MAHVSGDIRVRIISKMSMILKRRELREGELLAYGDLYARVNSIRERFAPIDIRALASYVHRRQHACVGVQVQTIIYVLVHAAHASRHAQFAFTEGEYNAKKRERRASARAEEQVETHTTQGGYSKKSRDVRDEGKGYEEKEYSDRNEGTRKGLTKRRERERRR